jgi:hypothetical protein
MKKIVLIVDVNSDSEHELSKKEMKESVRILENILKGNSKWVIAATKRTVSIQNIRGWET